MKSTKAAPLTAESAKARMATHAFMRGKIAAYREQIAGLRALENKCNELARYIDADEEQCRRVLKRQK